MTDPDDYLMIRGGGWMRQYIDSVSLSAPAPWIRLYASRIGVTFQIHNRVGYGCGV